MAPDSRPFALFRVAAGPRIGYGHLRRATVLARALRRPCAISVRGGGVVPASWSLAPRDPRAALAVRPRLLVVDDPRAERALPWVREARRRGVPIASLHDLGLGVVPSDLAIDGSLRSPASRLARRRLAGVDYAVIDVPRQRRRRTQAATAAPLRILVSFGGGDHHQLLTATLEALWRGLPDAHVIVPTGFGADGLGDIALRAPSRCGSLEVVTARDGLAPWLCRADLAVLGGGLTLYEAAALGVPAVAVPVVPAQRPTIRAFVRAGAAVTVSSDGGRVALARRIAARAGRLAVDAPARTAMGARGMATVDGRGARRVAAALRTLAEAARA